MSRLFLSTRNVEDGNGRAGTAAGVSYWLYGGVKYADDAVLLCLYRPPPAPC
jgi:hypothetical protein